jgi:hypothetical protein
MLDAPVSSAVIAACTGLLTRTIGGYKSIS